MTGSSRDERGSSKVHEKSKYSCHVRITKLHVHGVHSSAGCGKSNVDIRARKVTKAALLKKPAVCCKLCKLRSEMTITTSVCFGLTRNKMHRTCPKVPTHTCIPQGIHLSDC